MKRLIAALAAPLTLAGAPLATAGEVTVTVNSPSRYTMPEGVARVFVANPMVADVQVIDAQQMLVFGKMPGEADILLFGADQQRLDTVRVRVGNDRAGVVTLYNGAERFSFRCLNRCEQVPMLGDGGLVALTQLISQAQQLSTGGEASEVSETVIDVTQPAAAPKPQASAEPAS